MNRNCLSPASRSGLLMAAALAVFAALAVAQDRGTSPTGGNLAAESKERRREGTKFEGTGRFEVSGDRVAFYPQGGQESFRVLENLALERVSRVLGESREARDWTVLGVFTEFQGGNYLLLTRAVAKLPAAKGPGNR